MRHILTVAFALGLAGSAYAQTPGVNPDPQTPAVTTTESAPATNEPAKGANSFTEAQAKTRIEGMGFTDVTGLTKDDDGIWRGKAMKDGTSHDVALDYQGNVFPR